MAKIKRNDPCPCGSGKKYKQCHEPLDRARDDHRRLLRRAMDRLIPKLIEQASNPLAVALVDQHLADFWDGTYTFDQMSELDDLEDRGSERFLTWVTFDAPINAAGSTLVEHLAAELPEELEFDQYERELLPAWTPTRLRAYVIDEVLHGKGAIVRDVITNSTLTLRDHAAAKRLEQDEVLFAQLVPVEEEYYIAGAAAHATTDVLEQLQTFLDQQYAVWQIDHAEATIDQWLRQHSAVLNRFVMALPREEHPSRLDDLMLKSRVTFEMAKGRLSGNDTPPGNQEADEIDLWSDDEDEDETPTQAKNNKTQAATEQATKTNRNI